MVIWIDVVGMGGSSRPDNFNLRTFSAQQSIDYFVDYIEQWRVKMRLPRFYLAGHSFGGYIVGNYALKHKERVKRLLLISPVGIRVKPQGEDDWERFLKKSNDVQKEGGSPPPVYVKLMVKAMWNSKVSPFSIARLVGQKQTRKLIWDYIERRQKMDDPGQKEVVADYMYHLLMKRSTSEASLMVMFSQGLQALLPLGTEDKLGDPKLEFPVSFIMGDQDWVRHCDEDFGQLCVDARNAH